MPSINLQDELSAARLTRSHYWILLLAGVAIIFDGYDDLVIAFSLRTIAAEWHLSPSQAGGLISVGLFGLTLGAAIGGALADRLGRRSVMVWSLVLSGLGSIAVAMWATNLVEFLIYRFVTGLGLGALLPLISVYMSELAPKHIKNVVVGIVVVGFSLGGILASVGAIYIIPEQGWRPMFWIGGIGIPVGILCWFGLPESPLFLASMGRVNTTRQVMLRLFPKNRAAYAQSDFILSERPKEVLIIELFAPAYRRNTILIWIAAFLLVFATRSLTGWLPSVMVSRGETFVQSSAFAGMLLGMSAVGALLIAAVADQLQRQRDVLLLTLSIGALSVVGLAVINLHWTNLTLMGLAGFFVIGSHAVFYALTASVYETSTRSTGVGFMLGIGRVGGVVGPLVAGAVQQIYPGFAAYFVMVAGAAGLVVVILAMMRLRRTA